jgi:co-chaperonin GroES (HSP10)
MKIRPTGGLVLLEQVETDYDAQSIIATPDSYKEKPDCGKVLAIGPKVTIDIKPGDVVLYVNEKEIRTPGLPEGQFFVAEENVDGVVE